MIIGCVKIQITWDQSSFPPPPPPPSFFLFLCWRTSEIKQIEFVACPNLQQPDQPITCVDVQFFKSVKQIKSLWMQKGGQDINNVEDLNSSGIKHNKID